MKGRVRLAFALLSLFFISIDQISKAWAREEGEIWLNQRGSIFLSITGVILAGLAAYFWRDKKLAPWAISLLMAGGVSNLLDRIIWGGVADIFHIGTFSFNTADGLIVLGAVLLLLA